MATVEGGRTGAPAGAVAVQAVGCMRGVVCAHATRAAGVRPGIGEQDDELAVGSVRRRHGAVGRWRITERERRQNRRRSACSAQVLRGSVGYQPAPAALVVGANRIPEWPPRPEWSAPGSPVAMRAKCAR